MCDSTMLIFIFPKLYKRRWLANDFFFSEKFKHLVESYARYLIKNNFVLLSALVIQFVYHRFLDYHDPTIGKYIVYLAHLPTFKNFHGGF